MNSELHSPANSGFDLGALIARVRAILTSPRSEWPVIAAEPASVAGLYTGYFMVLAAIPAVFGFIKGSLIGSSMFGLRFTTPVFAGLFSMVLGYVLGLAVLYVVALIVNALASSFGGQKDQVQALKAVGYAWTAAWIAGIAVIVPWLGWLVTLAGGVYSIYLLYLGLPHAMKCPPEKSLGYTAVTVIIAVALTWALGLILAAITGMGALVSGALAGGIKDAGNEVTIDKDSRLGQLATLGKRMEAAGKQVEQAGASGGPDAQSKALGAMLGAMTGNVDEDGQPMEAVAPDQLRALLPETLGNRRRTSISASRRGGMGVQVSEASAHYAAADGSGGVNVEIKDVAAMAGMMAFAGAFGVEQSSETEHGFERTYSRDGQLIQEEWDANRKRGRYAVTIANRFQVEAEGEAGSIDELKQIVGSLDLRRVAAL